MYKASMSQELVKKKANVPVDLTEMQRRFVDYLVYNEGRTTHTDAAIKAGYASKVCNPRSIQTNEESQGAGLLSKEIKRGEQSIYGNKR